MTFAQFMRLKAGDVVDFNGTFRTIIDGPADDGHASITLAIRRRSWTGRAVTVYGWNDVKDKIRRTNQVTARVILPEERMRLEEMRFSPVVELRREWGERIASALRSSRRCTLTVRRLPAL